MLRTLVTASMVLALGAPALAQEHAYQYDDARGSMWSDDPGPAGEGTYSEYSPDPSATSVDVSVDLATPGASVTFDTFQDGLAPYGQWVTVAGYGRVWRPTHVAAGWRPYYYGRWEWTDEGWLWVSDEPWGWAAYHYGRWGRDPYYGWVWIPGYQWAPAWVTWRYSPEYIGWAPLGPGFSVYMTSYPVVYDWWTFVPCGRFAGVPVYSAAFTGGHVRGIFHTTMPAPPRASAYGAVAPAWGGPARPLVERWVGRPIAPVRVQPVHSPSAIGTVARPGVVPIYRPEARPSPVRAPVAHPPAGAPGSGPRASDGVATRAAPAPSPGAVAPRPVAPSAAPPAPAIRGGGWSAPTAAPRTFVQPPGAARAAPAPAPVQGGHSAPGALVAPHPQGGGSIAPRPPTFSAPPAQVGGGAPAPAGGGHPAGGGAPAPAGGGGGGGGHGHGAAPRR